MRPVGRSGELAAAQAELATAGEEVKRLQAERSELQAQIETGDGAAATALRQLETQNVSPPLPMDSQGTGRDPCGASGAQLGGSGGWSKRWPRELTCLVSGAADLCGPDNGMVLTD